MCKGYWHFCPSLLAKWSLMMTAILRQVCHLPYYPRQSLFIYSIYIFAYTVCMQGNSNVADGLG